MSLIDASAIGRIKIVNERLKSEVDEKTKNDALIIASKNGHWQVVKKLIESKANVNATTEIKCCRHCKHTYTSLQFAVEFCHTETVKILLDEGAEINCVKPRTNIIHKMLINKLRSRCMNELMKEVIDDSGNIRTIFPFPTSGGHHLLFQEISEYLF